jgi:rubrerythrin
MDDFAQVIFQNAVIKEQLAQKLYLSMAQKAKSEKIKRLFTKLAEEEILHEKLLSKFDISIVKKVNQGFIKDLNLIKESKEELTEQDLNDIKKALDFAITEEQKAYEDYNKLVNHLDFGEARTALKEIALQELKHRTILQKMKLSLTDNDWDSLNIKVPDN